MTLMTLACAEGKSWQSSWGTLWENGLMAGFAIFCSDSMIYLNLFNTISLGHGHSWPNVGNCTMKPNSRFRDRWRTNKVVSVL